MTTLKAQEVFDTLVNHLRNQKARSIRTVKYIKRDEIESALRGDNGLKCPAGALITDEEYKVDMEGVCFGSLLNLKTTPQSLKDRLLEHTSLVDCMNWIHDWFAVEKWEEEFAGIARDLKLTYNKPKAE